MPKGAKMMGSTTRSFLVLAAFLAFLITGFAPSAHAGVTVPGDPCADNSVNTNFQNAFGQVGYTKTNAAMQVLGMFGAIDVKAQYCWTQIQSLFETIGSLQASSMNPFDTIVSAIISSISSQILTLINNACSAALNTISSFKTFLLSQLNNMCIPMPNLNLGLGNIAGLSFANAKPCGPGSVPAFTFGYTATPVSTYNYRQFP